MGLQGYHHAEEQPYARSQCLFSHIEVVQDLSSCSRSTGPRILIKLQHDVLGQLKACHVRSSKNFNANKALGHGSNAGPQISANKRRVCLHIGSM